ncbi:hypothetical protein [Cyclobacterium marinum]|uniref:hypothetical protein n=1 Tax=Cyclobacterium marinum TaxID=104 RepID=UPI0011EBE379|nr:hypothetical protein [Cyclobacterium marinum]MBI0398015.1 hypothetical protein [Cyclobacterium marinum]
MENELIKALLNIEKELKIVPPMGAADLPKELRFRRVILELQKRICPQIDRILKRMKSEEVSLTTLIIDVLTASLSNIPIPIATIAKHVAAIGIVKFCKNPEEIISTNPLLPNQEQYSFEAFCEELGSFSESLSDSLIIARNKGVVAISILFRVNKIQAIDFLDSDPHFNGYNEHISEQLSIESGIILSIKPNAVAAERNGKYFVAMLSPLPQLIENFIGMLCAHPKFFPTIGKYKNIESPHFDQHLAPGFQQIGRMLYGIKNIHSDDELRTFINRNSTEEDWVDDVTKSFDGTRWNLRTILINHLSFCNLAPRTSARLLWSC